MLVGAELALEPMCVPTLQPGPSQCCRGLGQEGLSVNSGAGCPGCVHYAASA